MRVHIKKRKYFEIFYVIKLQQISDFFGGLSKGFLSYKLCPDNYEQKENQLKLFSNGELTTIQQLIFFSYRFNARTFKTKIFFYDFYENKI